MPRRYYDEKTAPPAVPVSKHDEREREKLALRISSVLEGQCPNGHGALERRREAGWCETCRLGWWVRTCTGDCRWCAKPCHITVGGPVIGAVDPRTWPGYPLLIPPELEKVT